MNKLLLAPKALYRALKRTVSSAIDEWCDLAIESADQHRLKRKLESVEPEMDIKLSSSTTIRLPNTLADTATFIFVDPDSVLRLVMPIAESDHFIAELGRLCSGQKTRGEVKLGTHEVVLSRKPNHITISKNTTWSPYHLNYNIETVRRAVERYMQKRQNYADDGHYRMPVGRL